MYAVDFGRKNSTAPGKLAASPAHAAPTVVEHGAVDGEVEVAESAALEDDGCSGEESRQERKHSFSKGTFLLQGLFRLASQQVPGKGRQRSLLAALGRAHQ